MENFHRTFTFTLQKRKKYCFFIKYYIPNPKIIKLSLFSNQIIILEYSVFFRFLSSLVIYFQTIFGFLSKKIFQSCSCIVRKNEYLLSNFLTIDLAKSEKIVYFNRQPHIRKIFDNSSQKETIFGEIRPQNWISWVISCI
jgi:hypothetical protein